MNGGMKILTSTNCCPPEFMSAQDPIHPLRTSSLLTTIIHEPIATDLRLRCPPRRRTLVAGDHHTEPDEDNGVDGA
jgi:hypothetical protein